MQGCERTRQGDCIKSVFQLVSAYHRNEHSASWLLPRAPIVGAGKTYLSHQATVYVCVRVCVSFSPHSYIFYFQSLFFCHCFLFRIHIHPHLFNFCFLFLSFYPFLIVISFQIFSLFLSISLLFHLLFDIIPSLFSFYFTTQPFFHFILDYIFLTFSHPPPPDSSPPPPSLLCSLYKTKTTTASFTRSSPNWRVCEWRGRRLREPP